LFQERQQELESEEKSRENSTQWWVEGEEIEKDSNSSNIVKEKEPETIENEVWEQLIEKAPENFEKEQDVDSGSDQELEEKEIEDDGENRFEHFREECHYCFDPVWVTENDPHYVKYECYICRLCQQDEQLQYWLDKDEGESDEQEEGGADEEEDEGVIRKKDAFKEPTASELQAAFLGNAVMLPSSDPLAHLDIAAQAVAQLASSGGGVIVARTGAASTDAAQKAKNMLLALVAQKQAGQKKEEEKNHFESEIEINDFPQNARWKVTHKDAMSRICDWTDCCITTKGTYVAPGKTVPPGEQKLYLLIEGPTHEAVKNARLEVKKILDEAVAMMPFQSPEGRTGKYSVV